MIVTTQVVRFRVQGCSACGGVQVRHKFMKTLGSGLVVIPDLDPGRNDKK